MGMKIVLIVLIVAFVLSFVSIGAGLFGGGGQKTNTPGQSNDPVTAANAKYQPTVAALTAQLQSDPTSYTALVNLGNTYFDWAAQIQQASTTSTSAVGADQPLWVSAKDAYSRAVKANPKAPAPVVTDYAITLFYTGETDVAISTVEKVIKETPDFVPAYFNAGIFYRAKGETSKAIGAFEKVVKLDPKGTQTNLQYAKQQLEQLKSGGTTTTP